jgi:hypothetical protein
MTEKSAKGEKGEKKEGFYGHGFINFVMDSSSISTNLKNHT